MKTLRTKILLYFATVTTIMILLLVVFVRNQIKNTNIPLTIDLSQQIITAKSGEVGAWINQRIAELKVFTENETLISMDMDRIKPYMRKMDESHRDEFESFAIVTPEGQAWVTNDTYINITNRPYFEKIKKEDLDYVISDPIQIIDVLEGRSKSEGVGYGMFNVNERIKLMFGNEYGININSEYGRGTEVILRHPLIIDDSADIKII